MQHLLFSGCLDPDSGSTKAEWPAKSSSKCGLKMDPASQPKPFLKSKDTISYYQCQVCNVNAEVHMSITWSLYVMYVMTPLQPSARPLEVQQRADLSDSFGSPARRS